MVHPLPKLLPLSALLLGAVLVSACGSSSGVCEVRHGTSTEAYSYSCIEDPDHDEETCTSGSTASNVRVWWAGKTCMELGYAVMSSGSTPDEYEIYYADDSGQQPGLAGTWSGATPTDGGTNNPYPLAVFSGIWASANGNLKVMGGGSYLAFEYVAPSSDPSSWSNAMSKGFIFKGKEWVRNIKPNGSNFTGEVLWKEWSSSSGVTAVYWSPGTLSFNASKTEMTITSSSNDGITSSAVMYKQP